MQSRLPHSVLARVLEESAGEAYIFDATTFNFVFVNKGARENLGFTEEELATLTPWDLKPEVPRPEFLELIAPLKTGERSSMTFETFHRRKDGSDYFVFVNLNIFDGDDGKLFYAAIQDVTDRKVAEARLQNVTNRLDAILNNTKMAIFMINDHQHCIFMNQAAEDLTGYEFAETVGRPLHDVIHHTHPDGRPFPLEECAIDRALPEGNQTQGEAVFVHKNGSFYPVGFTASPMYNEHGHAIGTVIEARNIAEELRTREAMQSFNEELQAQVQAAIAKHREIEKQLNQTQKMEAIGQLTGGVAHDFNNLLQVIGGSLGLLKRHLSNDPDARRLHENAVAGVGRGAKLASQLLSFARRQPLQPEAVNLSRVVRDMDSMLRRMIGDGIEIETIVGGGLWNCFVDQSQFENALLNLTLNARDAMQGYGRLTIEVGNSFLDEEYTAHEPEVEPGQYVMLAVSDTGCGMSPDLIDRAFDPFFTTKPESEGTGLGLSMVFGFVKQSGGHVKLYSEIGQGTTVRIYLPRTQRHENIREPILMDAVRGGSECILVVEDDAAVRHTTVEMLQELGYQVLQAKDADAAMTVFESGVSIDMLFTDVVMPGKIRAPDLARLILARRPGVAVLFTSGYTQNAIVHAGRLDEHTELLSKPYSRDELARKVRLVLGKQHRVHQTKLAPQEPTPDEVATAASSTQTQPPLHILVLEDEPLILLTAVEMLRGLGLVVAKARTIAEARRVLAEQSFDLLMVDDKLPDGSGLDFAEEAARQTALRGVVVASGASIDTSTLEVRCKVIEVGKPYDEDDLESAIGALR